MSRTAIVVIALLLIAGAVALVLRGPAPVQDDSLHANGIAFTGYSGDGAESWTVQAGSGSLDGDVGHLEDVDLTFYQDGESEIAVHGDQLQRDSSGSTLSGSVRVEQGNDLSLHADTIFWDERNEILKSGPVTLDTPQASVSAGAFHHDLATGLTTLTRDIDATVSRDDDVYDVTATSAEATSGRIVLLGDVSIDGDSGDQYRCQRLESDASQSSLTLSGDVSGTWNGNDFSSGSVQLDDEGIRMQGDVIIDLELLMMGEPHDT
jgi:hypothetical protein